MLFEKIRQYADTDYMALEYEGQMISYQELYQRLVFGQTILQEQGFEKGDIVLLKLENQFDFALSFLTLLSIPCWVIPIPFDMTQEEYEKVRGRIDAKVFDTTEYEKIKEYRVLEKALELPDTTSGGIYHMTSGSTSEPKLCVRTIRSLSIEGATFQKMYQATQEEHILSGAPIYHSYAMGAAFMTAMMSGCLLHIINAFVPRKLLRLIDEKKITILLLVPVMAKALCNTRTKKAYSTESIRIALVGSGPVDQELFDTMKEKYGISLSANYGSTETGGIISRITNSYIGSIGKPMKDVCVKICDEDKSEVGAGVSGQLWVKSPYMMDKYLYEEDGYFDQDGYYCSGDLASMNEDGYLYITGRIKHLINVGGKKVNPRELEEVIMKYPGVKDCHVTGKSELGGKERVCAFIVGESISNKDIYEHCLKHLSQYKCPSIIKFVKEIPKNSMGKIVVSSI